MIIAYDMDDTLFDFVPDWIRLCNKKFKENLSIEDIKSFNFESHLKTGNDPYPLLKTKGLYRNLKPFDDAVNVMSKYYDVDGFNFCMCSASPKTAYTEKHESVKEHFPFFDTDNIVFTKNKSLLRANVLIDDSVDNLLGFKGFRVLYSRPWNRSADKSSYDLRVYNHMSINAFFRALRQFEINKIVGFDDATMAIYRNIDHILDYIPQLNSIDAMRW